VAIDDTDFRTAKIMPTLIEVLQTANPPLVAERFEDAVVESLNGIASRDPRLAVERDGNLIRIFNGDDELETFRMPGNVLQWAATAEGTARAFRRASAAVSQASDREVSDAFYRGLARPLAPFASYRASDESRPVMEVAADDDIETSVTDGMGVLNVANLSTMSMLKVHDALTDWGLLGGGEREVNGVVVDFTDAVGHDLDGAKRLADTILEVPADVPVVILVNGATRGGPEIAAEILQERRRAVVYGTSTYGDAMEWRQIPTDGGGELALSTAFVKGPAGVTSQGQGLTPQVCATDQGISMTPQARTQARREGQRNPSPTLPLRLFCPPSPNRAVVAMQTFEAFDDTDREAWTRNAILLLKNPARYQAMLERVERATQPKR